MYLFWKIILLHLDKAYTSFYIESKMLQRLRRECVMILVYTCMTLPSGVMHIITLYVVIIYILFLSDSYRFEVEMLSVDNKKTYSLQ